MTEIITNLTITLFSEAVLLKKLVIIAGFQCVEAFGRYFVPLMFLMSMIVAIFKYFLKYFFQVLKGLCKVILVYKTAMVSLNNAIRK